MENSGGVWPQSVQGQSVGSPVLRQIPERPPSLTFVPGGFDGSFCNQPEITSDHGRAKYNQVRKLVVWYQTLLTSTHKAFNMQKERAQLTCEPPNWGINLLRAPRGNVQPYHLVTQTHFSATCTQVKCHSNSGKVL